MKAFQMELPPEVSEYLIFLYIFIIKNFIVK